MMAGRFRLPPETRGAVREPPRRRDRSAPATGAARRQAPGRVRCTQPTHSWGSLAGPARGRAGASDVVYVCDLSAAARGHTHGDELCHVVAGGPVPVSVVREAAVGAFVKVAVRDGTEAGHHRPLRAQHPGRVADRARARRPRSTRRRGVHRRRLRSPVRPRVGSRRSARPWRANQLRQPEGQVQAGPLGEDRA